MLTDKNILAFNLYINKLSFMRYHNSSQQWKVMLYFTRGWPPLAVYSGRFAFVAGLNSEEAKIKLKAAFKSPHTGEATDSVTEEIKHAQFFLRSYVGLALSGYRYLVRGLWAISRPQKIVEGYYRLRSHFYIEAYCPHEDLVAHSTEETEPSVIRNTDIAIIGRWIRKEPILSLVLLILSPLLVTIGWVFAKAPTLVTTTWDGPGLIEQNHSMDNWLDEVNQVGSVRTKKTTEKRGGWRKILRWIQLERIRPCSFEDDLAWLRAKARTENELYKELATHIMLISPEKHFPNTYPEYLTQILLFITQWVPSKPGLNLDAMRIKLVRELAFTNKSAPPWASKDPLIKKLVNFFYMHGN